MKKSIEPEMKKSEDVSNANKLSTITTAVTTTVITLPDTNALMANKQAYEAMKGHMSEYYDKFVENPASFGAEASLAEEIKNMNSLKAKGLWLLFKQQFKLKLNELQKHDLAKLLYQDLAEDGVTIASKEALKMLFKNPENPEFHLEDDMIATIKAMSSSDKDELMKATASLNNITFDESAGHKILSFVKSLWDKLAPSFENIFTSLVQQGIKQIDIVMSQKLPPDVAAIFKDGLEDIGEATVKVTSTTITKLLDGKSASVTIKESATIIGGALASETAEAAQKIVAAKTNEAMKMVESQLSLIGNSINASANHVEKADVAIAGHNDLIDHHA